MFYAMIKNWSISVEFHQFKFFKKHRYQAQGVVRWALVLGGFTVDLVIAA